MAEIVITEFMDGDVVRELAETHDVLYDPGLVDRPDDLTAAAQECRALIVRNRTRVAMARWRDVDGKVLAGYETRLRIFERQDRSRFPELYERERDLETYEYGQAAPSNGTRRRR